MEYRTLGNSGLTVSAFSLGSWLTYEFMEERDALAVIDSALKSGINFLDDARYDDRTGKAPLKSGYSEVVFGNLIRKSGWDRSKLIIANKAWLEFYPKQSLEEEISGSLGRLQMDYLDLVYCARPPASVPLIDFLREVDKLIKSGKARHWGLLFWPNEQIAQAYQLAATEGLTAPCATQPAYSLLSKSPVEDPDTVRLCETTGLGIVSSYSLYGGLLSGKYNQTSELLEGRFGAEKVEEMRQKGLLEKVDQVIQIAGEVGCTPAQLAMAYCLKNPLVSSVLFGATKPSQIEDNLRALEVLPRLTPAIMERLRKI